MLAGYLVHEISYYAAARRCAIHYYCNRAHHCQHRELFSEPVHLHLLVKEKIGRKECAAVADPYQFYFLHCSTLIFIK